MTNKMMRKQLEYDFTLVRNERLAEKTWLMELQAPADAPADLIARPGQYVNIEVEGKFLRRPISVCDWTSDGRLTLLYDVVGEGTAAMSAWQPGRSVNMLAPLGNGFDVNALGERPLLIGGGIGIAPLYWLAKAIVAAGGKPTVVLGFNKGADVVFVDQFREVTDEVYVATANGECGVKGFVTDVDAVKDAASFSAYAACGPYPMMRALGTTLPERGQLSLDERMACGFGICMCCCIATRSGLKGICKAGPVFRSEDLIWK